MRERAGMRLPCSVWTGTLAVLLISAPCRAQIVNTLRGLGSDEPGRSGSLGAFLSATSGNTENVSISGAGRLQWQGEVHRVRLLGDATRSTSGGATTEEASVVHVRHNARLSGPLASIAFVQHQHDRFQRLSARFLVGAGARWNWIRRAGLAGSWGLTPMLEAERIEGGRTRTGGRLSTFVSVLGRLDERTRIDLTTFLQPKLDDAGDLRAVASVDLQVLVTGRLSLVVHASVSHDTEPADRVVETDWKTRTGFSVEL